MGFCHTAPSYLGSCWSVESGTVDSIESGVVGLAGGAFLFVRPPVGGDPPARLGAGGFGGWVPVDGRVGLLPPRRVPFHRQDLVLVAKAADAEVEALLANGEVGWERAVAMVRLRLAGATDDLIAQSFGLDLAAIARLTASLKRIDSKTETEGYESRYLVVQKSWDQSTLKYWGEAVGVDAETIEKALWPRSDLLPDLPGVGRSQKLADAMSSICLDSLTGGSEGRAVTVAEVFIDAATTIPTGGELGVTLSSGSRVGPNTLAEVLCTGRIRTIIQKTATRSESPTCRRRSPRRSEPKCGGGTKATASSTPAPAATG